VDLVAPFLHRWRPLDMGVRASRHLVSGMTRYARKTDANHAAIRQGLRDLGWSVGDLSGAGDGVPDLVVRISPGFPHFLEIKSDRQPLSAQALTAAQERWHSYAHFITSKVTNLEEAIEALTWAKSRHVAMCLAASAK
jgi:hypothetical protein